MGCAPSSQVRSLDEKLERMIQDMRSDIQDLKTTLENLAPNLHTSSKTPRQIQVQTRKQAIDGSEEDKKPLLGPHPSSGKVVDSSDEVKEVFMGTISPNTVEDLQKEVERLRIQVSEAKYDLHNSEKARDSLRSREESEKGKAKKAERQVEVYRRKYREEEEKSKELEKQMKEMASLVSQLKEVQKKKQIRQPPGKSRSRSPILRSRTPESTGRQSPSRPNSRTLRDRPGVTSRAKFRNGATSRREEDDDDDNNKEKTKSSAFVANGATARSPVIRATSSPNHSYPPHINKNIFSNHPLDHENKTDSSRCSLPGTISPRKEDSEMDTMKADLERRKALMMLKMKHHNANY